MDFLLRVHDILLMDSQQEKVWDDATAPHKLSATSELCWEVMDDHSDPKMCRLPYQPPCDSPMGRTPLFRAAQPAQTRLDSIVAASDAAAKPVKHYY